MSFPMRTRGLYFVILRRRYKIGILDLKSFCFSKVFARCKYLSLKIKKLPCFAFCFTRKHFIAGLLSLLCSLLPSESPKKAPRSVLLIAGHLLPSESQKPFLAPFLRRGISFLRVCVLVIPNKYRNKYGLFA